MSNRKACLIAGVLAGIAGLLVFLVLHHLWIMPIWFILPAGLVVAAAGGLAAGWAYSELLPGLPARPWTIFAWAALVGLTLAPSIVLGKLRPPLFTGTGDNAALTVSVARVIFILLAIVLSASIVLVEGHAALTGKRFPVRKAMSSAKNPSIRT
jgi:hypothetical protein